uniref:non-specific serine/threonine protein kinase n=1 Tax=Chromera velia CCMP2878 TaxID=1169474 RepID=A0A0G4G7A2_9ALVE|eukprot:Cvel_20485.t1-p1 / transcript=Cvel_20485.t1 / gene=Cvel_20485 / organism=Chromera_velia_CCMP2878 / gene_product=Serine/threonine-protein kinase pkn3, putative / transcript_product=Serine/threonine-protein kinase pkn3, putative / location=Cvel_scaffold1841:36647-38434(+) / protein_length=361 / sequence_SO=supercontig / SO=protein_coding / is_pseudo=false
MGKGTEKQIGEGGSSTVFRDRKRRGLVIKELLEPFRSRKVARLSLREIKIAKHLEKCKGVIKRRFVVRVDMDDGGETVHDFIRRVGPSKLRKLQQMCGESLHALAQMHAAGVIHRDLKPENMTVTAKDQEVRLIDLEGGRFVGKGGRVLMKERSRSDCGSLGYCSPEMIRDAEYDFKTDSYSLGCVFYELATGKALLESAYVKDGEAARPLSYFKAKHRQLTERLDSSETALQKRLVQDSPKLRDDRLCPFFCSLLSSLLERDVKKRVTPLQALHGSDFFKDSEWASIALEEPSPAPEGFFDYETKYDKKTPLPLCDDPEYEKKLSQHELGRLLGQSIRRWIRSAVHGRRDHGSDICLDVL